jgi:hypothetical protein
MRRFLAVVLLAAAAPLVTAVAVQAAVTQSVDFTVKAVKKDRKKTRGGLTLRTVLKIADSSGAKPPPLKNTTLRFPKGAALNARYFKTCSESALVSRGPSGCPAASRIGTGTATGDARPILAAVKAKITMYNGKPAGGNPTILIYAQPEISSPLVIRGAISRQRGGPYGYVLNVDVPPIPTLPGQPNASVTFFDATTLDKTVKRKGRTIHYIEGPILCDGTFFLLDGAFSYEGGITNTVFERFTLSGGPRC